jgi:hypothetical protein
MTLRSRRTQLQTHWYDSTVHFVPCHLFSFSLTFVLLSLARFPRLAPLAGSLSRTLQLA